ncbi:DUF4279 domain-containing protein [Megalodesulfovibrio paquesii]
MSARCQARLILSGRFDPDELSRLAGMKPTGVRLRGDFVKGTIAQYEQDQWIVATPARPVGHCEDVLFDLFSLVSSQAQALHQAARLLALRSTVRLQLFLDADTPPPILAFSPEVMRRLILLDATLAVQVIPPGDDGE